MTAQLPAWVPEGERQKYMPRDILLWLEVSITTYYEQIVSCVDLWLWCVVWLVPSFFNRIARAAYFPNTQTLLLPTLPSTANFLNNGDSKSATIQAVMKTLIATKKTMNQMMTMNIVKREVRATSHPKTKVMLSSIRHGQRQSYATPRPCCTLKASPNK